jgi:hypothetical protein
MPLKCRKCGADIPDGDLFCPACGTEVQLVPDYNSVEYLLSQRKQKEQLKEAEHESSGEPKKKKHSALKAVLITLLVIALLAAAALGAKMYIDNRNLNSYDYQMQHARASYGEGNYAEAMGYINQALKLNPSSDEAEYIEAGILVAQQNYSEAIPILKDLITRHPDDADTVKSLIQIYDSQKDTDSIKALLEDSSDDIRADFPEYIAEDPVFDPAEGDYVKNFFVTVTAEKETIYYTTDGSDPTKESTRYSGPIQTKEGRNEIRALAVNEKGIESGIVIAVYNVTLPPPSAASISPTSGNYVAGTKITVTYPAGCKAYYAFDAVATDKGTEYTGPVEMQTGTHIFSVIVKDANGKTSTPVSETYIVDNIKKGG